MIIGFYLMLKLLLFRQIEKFFHIQSHIFKLHLISKIIFKDRKMMTIAIQIHDDMFPDIFFLKINCYKENNLSSVAYYLHPRESEEWNRA